MDPRQYNIAQLFTFITSTAVSEAELHLISIQPTDVGDGLLYFTNQLLMECLFRADRFFFPGLFGSNGH